MLLALKFRLFLEVQFKSIIRIHETQLHLTYQQNMDNLKQKSNVTVDLKNLLSQNIQHETKDQPVALLGKDSLCPRLVTDMPPMRTWNLTKNPQNPVVTGEETHKDTNGDKNQDGGQAITKHMKPEVSYVFMIQEAIMQSSERRLPLSAIYRYIETKYPYFKQLTGKQRASWRNSVRSVLHWVGMQVCPNASRGNFGN